MASSHGACRVCGGGWRALTGRQAGSVPLGRSSHRCDLTLFFLFFLAQLTPPPRVRACDLGVRSVVSLEGYRVAVFGGEHEPRHPIDNAVHVLDVASARWTRIEASPDHPAPAARQSSSLTPNTHTHAHAHAHTHTHDTRAQHSHLISECVCVCEPRTCVSCAAAGSAKLRLRWAIECTCLADARVWIRRRRPSVPSQSPIAYTSSLAITTAVCVAWRGVAWRGVAWRGVAWRGVACGCD
jgi:hypothetical protein